MSFGWEPELASDATATDDDLAAAGLSSRFDDQIDAEEWLSDNYLELADLGVVSVTLFDDDTKVYGPMSLDQA